MQYPQIPINGGASMPYGGFQPQFMQGGPVIPFNQQPTQPSQNAQLASPNQDVATQLLGLLKQLGLGNSTPDGAQEQFSMSTRSAGNANGPSGPPKSF